MSGRLSGKARMNGEALESRGAVSTPAVVNGIKRALTTVRHRVDAPPRIRPSPGNTESPAFRKPLRILKNP